jgi:methylenetetrahydrofolate dehydrogenase (NADP+)/methenyltetrahydrofolate cyclohydrolase
VGIPAAAWFEEQGSEVVLVDKQSDVAKAVAEADIVVLGAGEPGLLTPQMVKEGVVVLDAGTSESSGKLVGDADEAVLEKARLFTPVPGGIGPVAVAMIFKNLLKLTEETFSNKR